MAEVAVAVMVRASVEAAVTVRFSLCCVSCFRGDMSALDCAMAALV